MARAVAIAVAALLAPWSALAIEPPAELVMVDLQAGDGRVAEAGCGVSVHYTGWLFDPDAATDDPCLARGQQFDSSRNRQRPFNFPLGEGYVIPGWDIGVVGMQVGGHRCLVVPPDMAYGEHGAGGGVIPPNATLIFEVEVLSVADF